MMTEENVESQEKKYPEMPFEDTEPSAMQDLFITVGDPEKHGSGLDAYVSYNVITKTTRTSFDAAEYTVRRRYQDFLWLHNRLSESCPMAIIPPLPEKQVLKRLDRFSPEFIRIRQLALEKFLTRISKHAQLTQSEELKTFLTAKAWELTSAKKQTSGLMNKVGGRIEQVKNYASSIKMKNRSMDFVLMQDYVTNLAEKLTQLDRISQRIGKDQSDLIDQQAEYGPVFSAWANSETRLADGLSALSKCIEKNNTALKNMVELRSEKFGEALHEYVLFADSIKAVLRRRDRIQLQHDQLVEQVSKKTENKRKMLENPNAVTIGSLFAKDSESSKQTRLEKVDYRIDELNKQVDLQGEKMRNADDTVKKEYEEWNGIKRSDLKDVFVTFADNHIDYFQQCLKAWQDALIALQETDVGSKEK